MFGKFLRILGALCLCLILYLALLLVVGTVKVSNKRAMSEQVRNEAYQRYANLGSTQAVRSAVNRHHTRAFDRAYNLGSLIRIASFDEVAYRGRMDSQLHRPSISSTTISHAVRRQMERDRKERRQDKQKKQEKQTPAAARRRAPSAAAEKPQPAKAASVAVAPEPAKPKAVVAPPAPKPTPKPKPAPPVQWDLALAAESLASDDPRKQDEAIRWMSKAEFEADDAQRQAVTGLLLERFKQTQGRQRREVIAVLGVVGDASAVDPLLPLLEQNADVSDRRAAMAALGRIGDLKAAFPIARWIQLDTTNCENALISMGPAAEREVLKLLRFRDDDVDVSICRILEKIGTGKSIRALTGKTRHGSGTVRSAAERALAAVVERNAQNR